MRNRSAGFVVACWIVGCVGVTSAADPPIYVTEPLTITQPGSYILSRDIEIDPDGGGSALIVEASDVEIDFSGFRVKGSLGTGDPPVLIYGDNVRLHNGSVKGNREDPPAIRALDVFGLILEDLYLDSGGGVHLNGVDGFRLENLLVVHGFNTAFYGQGSQGTILNSETYHIGGWGGALFFSGDSLLVRSNTFAFAADGISVTGSNIDLIDNSLTDTWYFGMELVGCASCSLRRNFVSGPIGSCYRYFSDDGIVEGNQCSEGGEGGIWISGSRNIVRDNFSLGTGWGVAYTFDGDDNRHCRNQSRSYSVNSQDNGTGNRACEDLLPVEQACALGPLGQISAIQPAGDCDQSGVDFSAYP